MRQLASRVPVDVRAELAAAVAVLDAHGAAVAAALETLNQATTAAWWSTCIPPSLDPAELEDATDEEWERLESDLGIDRGWRVVDALARTQVV